MMSFRYMRVIVFFDLPTKTSKDIKNYSKFHKFLLKNGFMMLQNSVYSKIVLNQTSANLLSSRVRANSPEKGNIILLSITEKQFNKMEYIIGEQKDSVVSSSDRVVLL
ncbi:CRISPR/Cas system-associated endoribonuclease Cas2 [Campylobacter blaseri]|nr:CRISPR-associated endonuclease Cas2 [Campylobacter blaseri]QKF85281.1 CRISPR/Cas system-associated endoribonuclease Cas2 [Campylobacter blaseri]